MRRAAAASLVLLLAGGCKTTIRVALPTAPEQVTAVSGAGSLTLSWSPVASANAYAVYIGLSDTIGPGTVESLGGTRHEAPSPPFTVTGLTPGATVWAVIVPIVNDGEGAPSAPVEGRPLDGIPLTDVAWTFAPGSAGAAAGFPVLPIGDLNGDDRMDVAVGLQNYSAEVTDRGQARIFLGTAGGLEDLPAITKDGKGAGDKYGAGIAGGDIDNDGLPDLLIGAFGDETLNGEQGAVEFIPGDPLKLGSYLYGLDTEYFGAHIGALGDINADGFDDAAVSGFAFSGGAAPFEGRLSLLLGSPTGPVPLAGWEVLGGSVDAFLGARSGGAVGDLNGDGEVDLGVGAFNFGDGTFPRRGKALVFYGEDGAGTFPNLPSWTRIGATSTAWLGIFVSAAGDVDADGYDDMALGVVGDDAYRGKVELFRGGPQGIALDPDQTLFGTVPGGQFGVSVASPGDVDGDGRSDLIVGASEANGSRGQASLYLGTSAGVTAAPAWTAEGENAGSSFGLWVSGADVTGDGLADVLVGAINDTRTAANEGSASLYLGRASSGPTTDAGLVLRGLSGVPIAPLQASFSDVAKVEYSCSWTFGDGTPPIVTACVPGALTAPPHPYDAPGDFDITLRVLTTDSRFGCSVTRAVIR